MAEVMDDATAATILAVQLQDIQELDSDNGNQCRTIDCDAQLACRIYQEDLERQVRSLRDRHMAIRFGESPLDNEELPIASLPSIPAFHPLDSAESRTAPEKRTDPYDVNQQSEELDAPPIVCLQPGAIEQERPSRKRKATSPPPPTCKLPKLSDPETEDNCIACMSTILPNDLIRLSCEHSYCMECMVRLFTLAMTDETIFPPQCCGASIPLAKVQSQVTTQFENAFKERQVELGTQTSDRTYCSNQTCSIFLPTKTEDLRDDRATCPKCHTQTCIICKCGAHEGGYCSQDPTVVSLLETAAAEGYKQCPSCHLVIELTFGCHHMTCRCKTQFCYNCLTPWKHCQCDLWSEDRLLERAAMLIDRDGPQVPGLGQARDDQINEVARRVPGRELNGHIIARLAEISWTDIFLNVQIVSSGYASGAEMGLNGLDIESVEDD